MSYYKHHVFFCTNERDDGRPSCGERCASDLRDYAKKKCKSLGLSGQGKVRVNNAGCLDRCEEGPIIVVYPEEVWYHYDTEADVDEIVSEHLQAGRVVERLRAMRSEFHDELSALAGLGSDLAREPAELTATGS